jgi:hypothetical protein
MKSILDIGKATLAIPVLAAALAGCQADSDVSFKNIRNDLTPELVGQYETSADIDRSMAVGMNLETRMFWDDLRRTMYLDHPSRLSPFPTLMTSGSPR